MKKITTATLKSFVRKNSDQLFINVKSSFDGQVDGCEPCHGGFKAAVKSEIQEKHTLGFKGIWLVSGSRDYFKAYSENGFEGIEVSNCCGHFIVAVRKAA